MFLWPEYDKLCLQLTSYANFAIVTICKFFLQYHMLIFNFVIYEEEDIKNFVHRIWTYWQKCNWKHRHKSTLIKRI